MKEILEAVLADATEKRLIHEDEGAEAGWIDPDAPFGPTGVEIILTKD